MSGIERWNHEKHVLTKKARIYTATQRLQPLLLHCHSLGGPSGKTLISSWRVTPITWVPPTGLDGMSPQGCCVEGLILTPCCEEAMGPFRGGTWGIPVNSWRSCSRRPRVLPSALLLRGHSELRNCSNICHTRWIHANLWFQSRDSSHRGPKPLRTCTYINCFSSSDFLGICHSHRKLA